MNKTVIHFSQSRNRIVEKSTNGENSENEIFSNSKRKLRGKLHWQKKKTWKTEFQTLKIPQKNQI